ncbi:MAG: glycoside hydrolase family 88 protein [Firmicutes bacterium]|nr:glycoside hydrolase family 88 protein [Bacillota bacterium]
MQMSWVNDVWEKVEKKLALTSSRTANDMFPYTTENGRFVAKGNLYWWTNGFWVGILWLMYNETKDTKYKTLAESLEVKLDEPLYGFDGLHHDVGFMWLLSSVANYRLTGNEESKKRGMIAASVLASRYNMAGKFIRAWNRERVGWSIIDTMMNLPLLYWASRETDDPRFSHIAQSHADTVLETFIRPDGSVIHINCFDPETGELLENLGGQGYTEGSSWTRGQSWAIYGLALSYIHTKQQKYLDAAKKVAHYFIAALAAADDFVPNCDFRAPAEPVYKDTTAGVIAACGMIEISRQLPEFEKDLYFNAALKILKATERDYANWSDDEDSIIQMGTESYKNKHNIPIIYADYYFIEALSKLRGKDVLFW